MIPLSDTVPLRSSSAWPKFAKPEPLPVVYGRCTVPTIQYDPTRKFWLVADHAIAGVDAVLIDGKAEKTYAWRNTTDPTGHPVALIELGSALPASGKLAVSLRGKVDPNSGAMLENPADVLLDVLRLAGRVVDRSEIADFRAACADLRIAGLLTAGMTLRAQLAEIAESVGMLCSPAMPGIALRWPLESRPEGAPLYARFVESDLSEVRADCRHNDLYTRLRVEYNWDWTKNAARQSITLQADSAAMYGEREMTLQARWLTDTAAVVARGTAWLQAHARPRWALSFTADLESRIPPGGWFHFAHPLLPVAGDGLALVADWDWANQRQQIQTERAVGPIPAVATVGIGGLFAEPEIALKATYSAGVATLTITDPHGAPVRDAVITLGTEQGKTDRQGAARFKVARGTYPVTVSAGGFAPLSMEITL